MRHFLPFLFVVLSGCIPSSEQIEANQKAAEPVVQKAADDTVLFCAEKPQSQESITLPALPKFGLINNVGCNGNGCEVEFQDVESHWCFWGMAWERAITVHFEPRNTLASDVSELKLWRVRQGSEIKKVILRMPDITLQPDSGVFRAVFVEHDAKPVIIVMGDHTLKALDF